MLALIGNAFSNRNETPRAEATIAATTQPALPPSATPSLTPFVTAVQQLVAQPTAVATMTFTVTPSATYTPPHTQRPRVEATPAPDIWYVASTQRINVRASASTDARVVAQLNLGDEVRVYGQVIGGSVNGNTTWYEVEVKGQRAYIHSSLLPRTRPTPRPVQQQQQQVQSSQSQSQQQQVQLSQSQSQQQPAQPTGGSPYQCNDIDDLNCSDFSSRAAAQAHLNACGDEDRLDGNNDGLACESLR